MYVFQRQGSQIYWNLRGRGWFNGLTRNQWMFVWPSRHFRQVSQINWGLAGALAEVCALWVLLSYNGWLLFFLQLHFIHTHCHLNILLISLKHIDSLIWSKMVQMLSSRAVNTPVISAWSPGWLRSALQHGQARTPYREEPSYALISEN